MTEQEKSHFVQAINTFAANPEIIQGDFISCAYDLLSKVSHSLPSFNPGDQNTIITNALHLLISPRHPDDSEYEYKAKKNLMTKLADHYTLLSKAQQDSLMEYAQTALSTNDREELIQRIGSDFAESCLV